MNILAFLSMLILVITILTLIFGVIAYFLYKKREANKKNANKEMLYDEVLSEVGGDYVFFE
jgi:heme/copper-type cytochrome/quinol oxidase subunit 2